MTEHESVEKSRRLQSEPISLDDCLRAFTKEEELGEDELYYCSKCKHHRLAVKKLDIWRLPPILVRLALDRLSWQGFPLTFIVTLPLDETTQILAYNSKPA